MYFFIVYLQKQLTFNLLSQLQEQTTALVENINNYV